jgi:isopentenyldiphosphate isomerase
MGDVSPEIFEIIDEEGMVIGLASRQACHGNPSLLHRVVHVLVANEAEDLLLQKRSAHKDIQPGKWDTSVGGHLHPGEDWERAAEREMREELGIDGKHLVPLYTYPWRTSKESELVRTYLCRNNGPFHPNAEEISEIRFWRVESIRGHLGDGTFTPNLEEEFARYLEWKGWRIHA